MEKRKSNIKKTKSDNLKEADRYAKIKTVEGWFAKGLSKANIHIMIDEKFGLKSYSARNKLIKEVLDEINKDFNPEGLKDIALSKLDQLIEDCVTAKDRGNAIRAMDIYLKHVTPKDKSVEIDDGDKVYKVRFGE